MSIPSISKYLSLILRHAPEKIGVEMDENGWVLIDQLIAKSNKNGKQLDRELIESAVRENDKKRFTISDDGNYIRAAQGHSVKVDTVGEPKTPPDTLFHGTALRSVVMIMQEGLKPMKRQHVHLSSDVETAYKVGKRHGRPVVLEVDSAAMNKAGQKFWLSDNKVWLTKSVAPVYIKECGNV